MRSSRILVMSVVAAVAALPPGMATATTKATATTATASTPWVLSTTSSTGTYAPTFTGNGLLGVRVPPAGQGYAPGNVPAQSELAGFYAVPVPGTPPLPAPGGGPPATPDPVQQRANIPTWSTLTYGEGAFSAPANGTISNWRQSLDLRTGTITTSMTWTAPDGRASDLTYEVLTDRARANVGLVRLTVTPHFSGPATITDSIDGTPATLSTEAGAGADYVSVKAETTGIIATLASRLVNSANVGATTPVPVTRPAQSLVHKFSFTATSGQTYTFTKYVGVVSSEQASNTVAAAEAQAAAAASAGWNARLAANDSAWAALWRGRVDIVGDRSLATIVNASEFYLWSSTRAGVDWSVSPAGLSSNGYDGHIFWDAETWMFPSLLAMHPDLAAGMNAYRFARLIAAEQHAAATGYRGARFPWESALDGTEQIPPPVSKNSEGLYEQHITADIALAQWQYYLATGDRTWLSRRGWPVLFQAAAFWASRAQRAAGGTYHIDHVTGPDEENPNVNDEVYTNLGAKRSLQFAIAAAHVLHRSVPSRWRRIAAGLVIPGTALGFHPEFSGYRGQLVKQADVTLLQYPWELAMPARLAGADLNYYVPRTDPSGPSMSDAVNEIDTSSLDSPGCASYVYTERSFQPFIRDAFDQFSETRTGGAFTFMTGIGGFLQEFTYGYSGLRFGSSAVTLAPSLTRQLPGIVLHGLRWRGRVFTVALGQRRTTVSLQRGGPLPLITPVGARVVRRGHRVSLPTRRPDRRRSRDLLLCAAASATSTQPGAPALAATDGSPATGWQPAALPATLSIRLASLRALRTVIVRWGHAWPPAPAPNVPPPPGPVTTLRPAAYTLQGSRDGASWKTLAIVGSRAGAVDVLHFSRTRVRFLRMALTSTTTPLLEEVSAR